MTEEGAGDLYEVVEEGAGVVGARVALAPLLHRTSVPGVLALPQMVNNIISRQA